MKQQTPPPARKAPPPERKPIGISVSTAPSRPRVISKLKEPLKPEADNGSPSPSLKARSKVRSLGLKVEDGCARSRVGTRLGTSRNTTDSGGMMKKELEEKLELKEGLVVNLQAEVLGLKIELGKARSLNLELQEKNSKLVDDLAVARAKLAKFSSLKQMKGVSIGEYQSPNFKEIQKLIANKLENSKPKKEVSRETSALRRPSPPPPSSPMFPICRAEDMERIAPSYASFPPPPPPPLPPRRLLPKLAETRKAPTLAESDYYLKKQEVKMDSRGLAVSAHSSIVGEIQNRSAHLLAIRMDIETKGDFINSLIQKVLSAAYINMENIVKFMDWLDGELSTLADEQAVLKHFKWPERKADAMREAATEYRGLKLLEKEISSYEDDTSIPCQSALKKMASLLDKSEMSIQRLIKLRTSVSHSYQEHNIPIDWMLDSGLVSKIKQVSVKLANIYMKRLTMELESMRKSDRDSNQEDLMLQGLRFAHKAHQFAGGLDPESLCAFEEIRQHVPGNLGRSGGLLVAITSS